MDGILSDRRGLAYRSGMDRVRFGIYDFSPSTGELRRDGATVRLQAQPARVLAALVRRPGEVVTRETLQREVWGDGTHVDFERGLNFCIAPARCRSSADAPGYIETVPKQGYRFIAPLSPEGVTPASPAAQASGSSVDRRSPGVLLTLVLAVIVALAAGAAWNVAAPDPPTVIVVPFYNETGRPDLDTLARSMSDATVVRLATPERIALLSVIGNASALTNPFARQDVQQIAVDLDAQWVVIGQLKADAGGLRMSAHLIRAADMKHAWAQTFDDRSFALPAQSITAEAIARAVASTVASAR